MAGGSSGWTIREVLVKPLIRFPSRAKEINDCDLGDLSSLNRINWKIITNIDYFDKWRRRRRSKK